MSIIEKLASSLGRRDEVPNQELAKQIVENNDKQAVKELVENLNHKNKDIQSDCIKVLYEIGKRKPSLILPYASAFVILIDSKNNRLQWGAMTALNSITAETPQTVYDCLPKLASIADKGSVITKDNYVGILIKLCAIKEYNSEVFGLLNEQLLTCPMNQLPMYAENALHIIDGRNKVAFVKTLTLRLDNFEEETKRKRVEKILKRLR